MKGPFVLALRYIQRHPAKAAILFLAMVFCLYLPMATSMAMERLEQNWASRADETPLVIGARGSRFDLVLHALYFRGTPPATVQYDQVDAIRESGYAQPIPIYAAATAKQYAVVGTTLDYFDMRGLRIARGESLALLGDCVLGANVAHSLDMEPGERLITDPENVFDLAGAYPLNMLVTGILAPTKTPDDDAVFVDIKTAWVIGGYAHGHEDLAKTEDESVILRKDDQGIVANASLVEYTTITDDNRGTFHFHEEQPKLPLTAIIALPKDDRALTLLRGRYLSAGNPAQAILPGAVVDEILGVIFRIGRVLNAVFALTTLICVAFILLVVLLSVKLRQGEMETLFLMGCGRYTLLLMHVFEYLMIAFAAIVVTAILLAATSTIAEQWIQSFIAGDAG